MVQKNGIFILVIALLTASCNQPAQPQQEVVKKDTVVVEKEEKGYDPHYFNFQNTSLPEGFRDTAYAKFSNDSTEDRLTIEVPAGLVTQTKAIFRVITNGGDTIYEHTFVTSDLINGYATEEIKTDADMVAYVFSQARSFFTDGILDPNYLPDDSFLKDRSKDEFDNYQVFASAKVSNRRVFHYCLNEESHFYLGYSAKEKKLIEMISCC